MEIVKELDKFADVFGLGRLIESPKEVQGGLLHKMYRVTTLQGTYAVKVLNSEIMKRTAALQNMMNSEKIAAKLSREISAVVSLVIHGNQVQELDGKYYMVYPWMEGVSFFPPEITKQHCEAIGDILGRIHLANVNVEGIVPEEDGPTMCDWESYLLMAEQKGLQETEWCARYKKAIRDIDAWNKAACNAGKKLAANMVISHRDLDPKNVMWNGAEPYIIDWEAAGYVNPYQELLEVINYWADDGKGIIQKEHFDAIITTYKKYMNLERIDWDTVFAGSFTGMLGWLEYSLKRAMGLEAADVEEIQSGEQQVKRTLDDLYAYQAKVGLLQEWLQ